MAFSFNPVPNKFQPKVNESYLTINEWDRVCRKTWNGHDIDKQRMAHNNVFKTVGEAKAVRDKIVQAKKDAQR